MWRRLRTKEDLSFEKDWRHGRDYCCPDLLKEFKAAHDALAQQNNTIVASIESEEALQLTSGDRAIARAPLRRKLREEIRKTRLSS